MPAHSSVSPTSRRRLRGAALLLAIGFAALFGAISRGVFVYGDDVLMFQVTEAMVERREVAVSSSSEFRTTTHSIVGEDGRRYAKYGLAPSLLAVPFYAMAHPLFDRFELFETRDDDGNLRTGTAPFGTALANAAWGGVAVGLTFLLAIELGAAMLPAFGAAFLLGCGTLWAHYSATFLSEPLAGAALALSLFALAVHERTRRDTPASPSAGRWLALSGFAAGLLAATKLAHGVLLVPLAAWIVWNAFRRDRLLGVVRASWIWGWPIALWLVVIGVYNASRFGNPFATGYGDEATLFTTPLSLGLEGLLVSPGKGVLWYCPVLFVALVGFFRLVRARNYLAACIGAMSGLVVLLTAAYYQWYGGGAWGPRLLVPMLPVWMACAGLALSTGELVRPIFRAVATAALLAVCVASLATTLAGVLVPFDGESLYSLDTQRKVRRFVWVWDRSPLRAHLLELPDAMALTVEKLLPGSSDGDAGQALAARSQPDFAFVRYGSHALLQWTRGALLVWLLATLAACYFSCAPRRDQKALESSPPQ